jgi:hypothetical protein
MTTIRPEWCEGHESLDGPIGETVYCDGTCVSQADRAALIEEDRQSEYEAAETEAAKQQ